MGIDPQSQGRGFISSSVDVAMVQHAQSMAAKHYTMGYLPKKQVVCFEKSTILCECHNLEKEVLQPT